MEEALRRRAELPPSSAGIGADSANNLSPTNPLANAGVTPPQTPSMAGGAEGQPSGGAVKQLKQEKGEARVLTDALIWRMRRLTTGQASQ